MSESTDITVLAQQLSADSLAKWDGKKRQDFVDLFDARVRSARYILRATGALITRVAEAKHFISQKHIGKAQANGRMGLVDNTVFFDSRNKGDAFTIRYNYYEIGGRTLSELDAIAKARAEDIIAKLPSLAETVRIINPEIAKMITKRAELLEEGKRLLEESKKVSGQLDMADLDQKMTIAEFRELVKRRERQRIDFLNQMNEAGSEGMRLSGKIDKFLYEGLPGLSEAVIKVITDLYDREAALASFNRRIQERVLYGDSEAAMAMLKSFEDDELKVSDTIQSQFDEALDKLKLAAKKAGSKTSKLEAGKK